MPALARPTRTRRPAATDPRHRTARPRSAARAGRGRRPRRPVTRAARTARQASSRWCGWTANSAPRTRTCSRSRSLSRNQRRWRRNPSRSDEQAVLVPVLGVEPLLGLVDATATSWLPELPTGRANVLPLPWSTITIVLTGAAAGVTLTTVFRWNEGHPPPLNVAPLCATGGSSGLPHAQRALGTPRLSTSTAVPGLQDGLEAGRRAVDEPVVGDPGVHPQHHRRQRVQIGGDGGLRDALHLRPRLALVRVRGQEVGELGDIAAAAALGAPVEADRPAVDRRRGRRGRGSRAGGGRGGPAGGCGGRGHGHRGRERIGPGHGRRLQRDRRRGGGRRRLALRLPLREGDAHHHRDHRHGRPDHQRQPSPPPRPAAAHRRRPKRSPGCAAAAPPAARIPSTSARRARRAPSAVSHRTARRTGDRTADRAAAPRAAGWRSVPRAVRAAGPAPRPDRTSQRNQTRPTAARRLLGRRTGRRA